jgi:hypothetical protein
LQGLIGATGPQGATGAAGTNGIGFNFRNTFDASLSYAINDVVIFNGSSYVAIVASAGPKNPTPDTNTDDWSVMAQQGAAGTAGATGSTGSTGPQGLPGATGATGATGPQGAPGIDGPQGATGATGAAGTNGTGFNFRNAFDASLSYAINDVVIFSGSSYVAIVASAGPSNPTPDSNTEAWSVMAQQGAAGTAGAAGAAGEQGATGTAGATGSIGETGPQGLPGATGVTGAIGPQGLQGLMGETGATGATGAAGTNGTGFNFRNTFDASLSYAINDVVIFSGASYVAIVASAGPDNPTPDGNTEAWSVMAQQGAAGIAGATGSTGSTGPQGLPGATGAAGATGPQGAPGIDGPQGSTGATGAEGTNGTGFNFRNAFDASVSYAINDVVIFTGSSYVAIVASAGPDNPTPDTNTEAWSVMAQQGATGIAGATGSTGSTGPQGLPGATGVTGATGPQGVPGIDGAQGATGTTGAAGTNGTGFNFRNTFDASLSYAINDVVIFNGSSYVAIVASAGPDNPTPDGNTEAWSVMAQQGATGTAGATGAQGATGTEGATGPTGATGATGAAGATGPQGAPGIDGATGSQGPAGASPFTLDGSDAVFTTGSVGLGVDPPSNTAALDVSSTTKGLLAPRMTTVQRLAIASPANGLIVFDTDTKSLQVYDAVGEIWNGFGAALGTVQVASGGTGATTLTGYLLGAGTSAITASTTIPGTAISGNISGNAANVTGTVPVTNGGTGATTLTGYLLGAGTSAVTASATIPGTAISGNIGGSAGNVTGLVAVGHGGTGATTFAQGRILYGTTTTPVAGTVGMFWDSVNSRLGVGTTSPSFPVDIETSVSHDFAVDYGFLSSNDFGLNLDTGNVPYSLYASNRIVANEFDAISDARSKHVIGRSDIASDLDTLKKLRITDYRYIDVVEKGHQRKKGVIAQEVEKVYPDAVRITSDFIPSVYAMAVDTLYNEAAHELTVTVRKAHGFTLGDMVRIITADTGNLDKPVAAVLNDDTFVLSGVEKDPGRVFVFGKKVDDFHVVDYDQLFSMNIGATQQLAAENQDLRARLAALEQAVALLQQPK